MPARAAADLSTEATFFGRGLGCVVGMDEVGRGALAGPVTVGAAAVGPGTRLEVPGLTDSKMLTPARREAAVPQIRDWIPVATGSAQPEEIDELGMTLALRLAGRRALAELAQAGICPEMIILDGKHDWLSADQDLLGLAQPDPLEGRFPPAGAWEGPVHMKIKADLSCASVAAASVVAKVERDEEMVRLSEQFPQFGWAGNKGYGAAGHRAAIQEQGPSIHHRLSWSLGASDAGLEQARALRRACA